MIDVARLNGMLSDATLVGALIASLTLVVLMPARVLQKRHGYSPWVLALGVVPYLGPLLLLWGLAVSTPAVPKVEKVVA